MNLVRLSVGLVSLLYPLAVYLGLRHFDPRSLVLLLVAVAGLRVLSNRDSAINYWLWVPCFGLLTFWILFSNSDLGLKLYPVLLNLSFLIMFAWSVWNPPTVIERLARLRHPDLPDEARGYTRVVTCVWCGFFLLNCTVSLATALWASDEIWALYNGLIAYLLVGALFAGEWLVRQRVMGRVHG
ncbi:hypothetical protein ACXYTJ_14260 [Gilvimarinus sp. F26214L]|uniref:hypothetical protein n=1 Tax=Gilvimarinus sp. DZF01 TaxID=3461371 RepID=UPI0040465696